MTARLPPLAVQVVAAGFGEIALAGLEKDADLVNALATLPAAAAVPAPEAANRRWAL